MINNALSLCRNCCIAQILLWLDASVCGIGIGCISAKLHFFPDITTFFVAVCFDFFSR